MPDNTSDENQNPIINTETPEQGATPENNQQAPETTNVEAPTVDDSSGQATNPSKFEIPSSGEITHKKSKKSLIFSIIFILLATGGAAWWYGQSQSNDTNEKQFAASELQDIEQLTIGTTEGPASLFFPEETVSGVQIAMDRQIYEGLVALENNKIVPLLAQSWTNPDENTWVFKLRPNVQFHTGRAVDAEAVKASLDKLKDYEYWSLFVSTIESVEATSTNEVTIKTKEPDSLLLNRLALAFISDLNATDRPGTNGTGAYLADTNAGNSETQTTLIPNDNYHRGKPKTRKIVYKIYGSDEEIIAAYKNGEINIAETAASTDISNQFSGSNTKNQEYTSPGVFGLYMNQLRPGNSILKNKDFRQAIAQAVNRIDLIKKVGTNNVEATQVIPSSLPGYDPKISFPAFDLTAAKASLSKSGYKNQPLDFFYIKDIQTDAPIIIDQLKALGLNLRLKEYTSETIDDGLAELKKGNFDFLVASFTSDISDARDILGGLLSSTESIYPVYNNTEYDMLLADSDEAFDPTERVALLQQANKHVLDNFAWVPLRTTKYIVIYPADIDFSIAYNGGGNAGVYYYRVGKIVNP